MHHSFWVRAAPGAQEGRKPGTKTQERPILSNGVVRDNLATATDDENAAEEARQVPPRTGCHDRGVLRVINCEATVRWTRQGNERFLDNRYSRAHEWAFDGGARIHASASPHVVRLPFSDPSGVDPEEAFVAAIASCHMLFFLSFAARQGFTIDSYDDNAVGVLSKGADGREWMTKVTLRPHVVFSGDTRPTEAEIDALHHEAHAACYIANSVKTDIVVDAESTGLR
jgi:organic hydroperoxide reductase OsmC/OhrA